MTRGSAVSAGCTHDSTIAASDTTNSSILLQRIASLENSQCYKFHRLTVSNHFVPLPRFVLTSPHGCGDRAHPEAPEAVTGDINATSKTSTLVPVKNVKHVKSKKKEYNWVNCSQQKWPENKSFPREQAFPKKENCILLYENKSFPITLECFPGGRKEQAVLVEVCSLFPEGNQTKSICITKDPALQPAIDRNEPQAVQKTVMIARWSWISWVVLSAPNLWYSQMWWDVTGCLAGQLYCFCYSDKPPRRKWALPKVMKATHLEGSNSPWHPLELLSMVCPDCNDLDIIPSLWNRSCLLSFNGVFSSFTSSTWKATWAAKQIKQDCSHIILGNKLGSKADCGQLNTRNRGSVTRWSVEFHFSEKIGVNAQHQIHYTY